MKPRNTVPGAPRRTDGKLYSRLLPAWLALLLGAVCLVAAGCGGESDAASGEGKSALLPVPARSALPVRDGQFEFILAKTEIEIPRIGGPTSGDEAEGQFAVVHVQVTNTSDTRSVFDYSHQELLDDNGAAYTPHLKATMALNGEFRHEYGPGASTTLQLAFDIAEDATPAALVLHGVDGSPGARVELS
ncbi:MAG TPA: DUF4352 domain-containing protein [Nocardia sp.]|uniref:DUF4352 domain-containing protein n=1 Tax=Nocardia sp. TaxID=1821 RepID=UPI002B4B3F8C|nr:DUF4352 domain-containing protein [Nocardia sp.]HLS78068.1 DUF4352 domain-containing protein [Nocardia sp.]